MFIKQPRCDIIGVMHWSERPKYLFPSDEVISATTRSRIDEKRNFSSLKGNELFLLARL